MNKKYLQYLLTTNKKLILVLSIICTVLHIFPVYTFILFIQNKTDFMEYRPYSSFVIVLLFICAYILPIIIHEKQLKTEGSDVVFALPITREKRVVTEIIYGWIVLFLPFIISCLVVSVIGTYPFLIRFQLWGVYLFYIVIISALYILNTLIVMKCNSTRDAIIVCGLYLFNFLVLFSRINLFLYENSFNFSSFDIAYDKISLLIVALTPISALLFDLGTYDTTLNITIIIFVYLMYCIIFMYFILRTVKSKKVEQVSDITTSTMTYPFALSAMVALMLLTSTSGNVPLQSLIGLYITLFVAYIGINFIAQRKFKLRLRHILLFVVSVCISYGLSFAYIQSDGLGSATVFRSDDKENMMKIVYFSYYDKDGTLYEKGAQHEIYVTENNADRVYKASQEAQEYLLKEYRDTARNKEKMKTIADLRIFYDKSDKYKERTFVLSEKDNQKVIIILKKYDLIK